MLHADSDKKKNIKMVGLSQKGVLTASALDTILVLVKKGSTKKLSLGITLMIVTILVQITIAVIKGGAIGATRLHI